MADHRPTVPADLVAELASEGAALVRPGDVARARRTLRSRAWDEHDIADAIVDQLVVVLHE